MTITGYGFGMEFQMEMRFLLRAAFGLWARGKITKDIRNSCILIIERRGGHGVYDVECCLSVTMVRCLM